MLLDRRLQQILLRWDRLQHNQIHFHSNIKRINHLGFNKNGMKPTIIELWKHVNDSLLLQNKLLKQSRTWKKFSEYHRDTEWDR
jgi:hypothetical protein